jgi:hypothetical protein
MLQVPTPPKQVLTRGGGVPMESETPIFSPLEDEMSTPQLAATTAAMWVVVEVPKEIDPGTSIINLRSQSLCRRKPAFKLQSFFFFVFFVVWASSHSENNSKILLRFLDFLQGFSHIYCYFIFYFLLFLFAFHLVSLVFLGIL